MKNTYQYKGASWVSLISPTKEEVDEVMDTYKIDPRITQDLTTPTPKPAIDSHDGIIYLVLHFPSFRHTHSEISNRQEIDFVIGKDFVVTTQYEIIDSIDGLRKELEVDSILKKENGSKEEFTSALLFFFLVKQIYLSLFDELSYIEDQLLEIENKLFKGKEKEIVFELSLISRTLISFKKTISQHEEVLFSLEQTGSKTFNTDFGHKVRSLLSDYYRIINSIDNNTASMDELRETNNAMLSTKQNEVMKNLTLISFIMLPLSLIAGIFGINAKNTPIIGNSHDFWIIVAIMALAVVLMFAYFKYRKWL